MAAETPAKLGNAITLELFKIVGQMVKTIGGFRRLHEMLGVIKEVGGLKTCWMRWRLRGEFQP